MYEDVDNEEEKLTMMAMRKRRMTRIMMWREEQEQEEDGQGEEELLARKELHNKIERVRVLEGVVELGYPWRGRGGKQVAFGEDVGELWRDVAL